MPVERYVVDNRVFLLGLDKLYRDAIKQHERGELLTAVRCVTSVLQVAPANVPVEGYYPEEQELTEYFRLVRALQEVDESRTAEVSALPEFQRLREVMSAPLFGRPQYLGKLLPVGRDALSEALLKTRPQWTVVSLTRAAYEIAKETDDISLVGLAARLQDSLVLAAMRESVVLYELKIELGIPPPPEYVWQVDDELAELAGRFIRTFNALFDEELPPPNPAQAERYWHAYEANKIIGRCVRLGCDDTVTPLRHYHWGICRRVDGEFKVQEFWHSDVWTTARYRSALSPTGLCPRLTS